MARSRRRQRTSWWDGPRGRSQPPPGTALSAPRSRSKFGATWWGRAWIDALEQRARLDPNRLPRGRSYARSGAVGDLVVHPGEVEAAVQGSRAAPYRVRLRVREFVESEWDRVMGAIAARAAHAAALLDGELDPGIVDDIAGARLSLLPAAGELGPMCSCPDWADPCKHAAAVCYLVADRMDADPFTIFLVRGRTRGQVLAGVRRLRAEGTGSTAAGGRYTTTRVAAKGSTEERSTEDSGVEARSLVGGRRATPSHPLPPPPLPPPRPGVPASLAADPPPMSGVRAADLLALAADAARRAHDLCIGTSDGGLTLDADSDLARLAADRLGRPGFDEFAQAVDIAPRALMRLALAWKAGGAGGVGTLDSPLWRPPREVMAEGVRAVRAATGVNVSPRGNRVTERHAGVQLRYGHDGLWYLFMRKSGTWELHVPPTSDPASLRPVMLELADAASWQRYPEADDDD